MTRTKVWKPDNYQRGRYHYNEETGLGHQTTTSGYHVWHNPRVEIDEGSMTDSLKDMIREAGCLIEEQDETVVLKKVTWSSGYQNTRTIGKYKERSTMLTYYRAWLDRFEIPTSPTER